MMVIASILFLVDTYRCGEHCIDCMSSVNTYWNDGYCIDFISTVNTYRNDHYCIDFISSVMNSLKRYFDGIIFLRMDLDLCM
jgi:hypothetical protein